MQLNPRSVRRTNDGSMASEPTSRSSVVSCVLTGIGGAGVACLPCGLAYGALSGIPYGFSDAPGHGLAAIAGMIFGAGAGFVAGIARYFHLFARDFPASSRSLEGLVPALVITSLLIAAAPAIFYLLP